MLFLGLANPQILQAVSQLSYPQSSWFAHIMAPSTYRAVTRPLGWVADRLGGPLSVTPDRLLGATLLVALIASGAIILGALIRQARAGSGYFPSVTVALLLGLFVIPLTCWLLWILRWITVGAWWVMRQIARFFVWSAPFWKVVIIVVVAGAAIAAVVFAVRALFRAHRLGAAVMVIVGVGLLVALIFFGQRLRWWIFLAPLFAWLGSALLWLTKWVLTILAWIACMVIIAVGLVTVFAYPGFILWRSISGAFQAGTGKRRRAIEFATGVGVGWSLLFTAAATVPSNGAWLSRLSPDLAPKVIGLFRVLIPDSFEPFFGSMLRHYSGQFDVLLLAVVAVVGCLTLMCGTTMIDAEGSVINVVLVASIIGVAVATVVMVPALAVLVTLLAGAMSMGAGDTS